MTKIVTVSMVKNEQDIIEAFVRYHAAIVDHMIILDNGSTDESTRILEHLIDEGLSISVLSDDDPAFVQAEKVTRMVYDAFNLIGADLVIPLDADEFLCCPEGNAIRQVLESLPIDRPSYLEWLTYIPTEADDANERNPVIRIRHRRVNQHNHDSKLTLPRPFFDSCPGLSVTQGNHYVVTESGDRLSPSPAVGSLALAHFPIRNPEQARSKYLVGWLANLARPDRVLFDWYPAYNLSKQQELSPSETIRLAVYYNILDKNVSPGMTEAPLDYTFLLPDGFDLRYAPRNPSDALLNVLNYSEHLASSLSSLRGRNLVGVDGLSDQLILQIIRRYELIDGWLSPREAIQLYRIAASIESTAPVICEIGSWLGRSSYILAKAIEARLDGLVYCVDPFDGSGDAASEKVYRSQMERHELPLEAEFQTNMARHGVSTRIRQVKKTSQDALDFVPKELDLLFIDGDHSFDMVLKDYEAWAPRVKPGGWIAFHDVGAVHASGPKSVVERYIVPNKQWGKHCLMDELFAAQRLRPH
ncbi:MAG: class I SAM-dependent methyltransferase [Acidobacteriota bacterium]